MELLLYIGIGIVVTLLLFTLMAGMYFMYVFGKIVNKEIRKKYNEDTQNGTPRK